MPRGPRIAAHSQRLTHRSTCPGSRELLGGGVVGAVAGFGDGQGTFGQGSGGAGLTQVVQDLGEGVQAGGDGGVVGAVAGFSDGQGTFGQGSGGAGLTQVAQDLGEGVQAGGDGG